MSYYSMKTSFLLLLMVLSALSTAASSVGRGKDEFSGRLHGSTHTVLHSTLQGAQIQAENGRNTVRTTLAYSAFVNVEPGWSNATFAQVLCDQVDSATQTISIYAEESDPYFELPSCINTTLVGLRTLEVRHVIINDISMLPNYMSQLRLLSSSIADWSVNGVSWPTLWDQVPYLSQLLLNDCNVTGTLYMSSLPQTMRTFDVSDNAITGPVPKTLFVSPVSSAPTTFFFKATNNQLSGALEEEWLSPFSNNIETLTILLSNNKLSGLPVSMFGTANFSALISVTIALDSNVIEGHLDTRPWFENWRLGYSKSVSIDLSHNLLNGTLPSHICYTSNVGSPLSSMSLRAGNNKISGELSPTLLDGCGFTALDLSYNSLQGAFPNELIFNLTTDRSIVLTANQLTDFPGNSISTSARSISLALDLNNLTRIPSDETLGSIHWNLLNISGNPEIGKPKFDENGARSSRSAPAGIAFRYAYIFEFSNCSFAGALPEFEVKLDDDQVGFICPIWLNLAYNSFVGSIPSSWSGCTAPTTLVAQATSILDLSHNPGIFGPIPPNLWNFSTHPNPAEIPGLAPVTFLAANTSLSGIMPIVSNPNDTSSFRTVYIVLNNSAIDFCSTPLSLGNITRPVIDLPEAYYGLGCNLNYTNACECPELWIGCDTSICRPKSLSDCDPKTRPSTDFFCFNGAWTTTSSLNTPTLTIPAGKPVTILGNLTTSQVIISPGGSLIIEGCANVSEVVIQLSEEALKKGQSTQTLITSLGNCGNLDTTSLKTQGGTGCKKVKVERGAASHASLSVLFSVDTTSCNLWWIILASVLGLLLISGIILTILLLARRKAYTPASRMGQD